MKYTGTFKWLIENGFEYSEDDGFMCYEPKPHYIRDGSKNSIPYTSLSVDIESRKFTTTWDEARSLTEEEIKKILPKIFEFLEKKKKVKRKVR